MDNKRSFTACLLVIVAAACGDDGGRTKELNDAASPSMGTRDASTRDARAPGAPNDDEDDDDEPSADAGTDEPNGPDNSDDEMDAALEAEDAGASVGADGGQSSATIGAAGGQLKSPDGRLTLEIPSGALSRPTLVTIQALATAPEGTVGTAYEIRPAHDLRHSHLRVIDDARELIARHVVFPPHEEVAEVPPSDRTLHAATCVHENDLLAIRHAKAPVHRDDIT